MRRIGFPVRRQARKRFVAAGVLKRAIGSVWTSQPNAGIVVVGDLNDEPDSPSLVKVLEASMDRMAVRAGNKLLYNLWDTTDDPGTYLYRSEWVKLDNILVSKGLRETSSPNSIEYMEGFSLDDPPFRVVREPFLLYEGRKPNRSYVGDNYTGGTSDHLPIVVRLRLVE